MQSPKTILMKSGNALNTWKVLHDACHAHKIDLCSLYMQPAFVQGILTQQIGCMYDALNEHKTPARNKKRCRCRDRALTQTHADGTHCHRHRQSRRLQVYRWSRLDQRSTFQPRQASPERHTQVQKQRHGHQRGSTKHARQPLLVCRRRDHAR
eukprot:4444906-Prymnesium_polylepis.1